MGTRAGWVAGVEAAIVVVSTTIEAGARVAACLYAAGLWNLAGVTAADPSGWAAAGLEVQTATALAPESLVPGLAAGELRLLDVRDPAEWHAGHVAGSLHLPLSELGDGRTLALNADRPLAVACATGGRAALAGPLREAAHVGFDGADLCPEAQPAQRFGGSIPLDKAFRPEVLLAWAMNGEPLPLIHGAPLRVVVPGYIGARSVKWLERIEVRAQPWDGYFQHVVYRLVPEDGTPGPGAGISLGLVALNSEVLSPADGKTVAAGPVEVRGYAFAGGERHVARVRLARRRRELVSGGPARGSRPVGLASVADHGRARARRARDPSPRLGLLGRHAARGRGRRCGIRRAT